MIATSNLYLTGNPIRFKVSDPNNKVIGYTIYIDDSNDSLYNGSCIIPEELTTAELEISDILKTFVKSSPISGNGYLIPAPDFMVYFSIHFPAPIIQPSYGGYAIYGGIPKKMYRKLSEMNTNIFEYKYFKKESNNYVLTTRTASKQIQIRETEICPLMFMYQGEDFKFVSHSGKTIHIPPQPGYHDRFVGFNLEKILYDFFTQKDELTHYINVLTDDKYSFSIAVLPTVPSEEKYILEFRNSLGAYERIELSGKASSEPKFEDEELFNVYDKTVSDFTENRKRTLTTETIKCECGCKTHEELLFLRDLISSDDIRILGPDKAWAKVHVTVEEYAVDLNMTEPKSIPLIIRFDEKEEFYLPNLFVPDSAGDTEAGTGWLGKGFWNANGFLLSNSPWISGQN